MGQLDLIYGNTGDVVVYQGVDYIVSERKVYTDTPRQWLSLKLEDGVSGRKLLLGGAAVFNAQTGEQELKVTRRRQLCLDLTAPWPERIDWQGRSFGLQAQGRARVRVETERSQWQSEADYWDYGDLFIERWDGDESLFWLGEPLPAWDLTVLAIGGQHA